MEVDDEEGHGVEEGHQDGSEHQAQPPTTTVLNQEGQKGSLNAPSNIYSTG